MSLSSIQLRDQKHNLLQDIYENESLLHQHPLKQIVDLYTSIKKIKHEQQEPLYYILSCFPMNRHCILQLLSRRLSTHKSILQCSA